MHESEKWKVKVKSLSHVRLLVTPWGGAYQAPPSMGFAGQEYCTVSGSVNWYSHYGRWYGEFLKKLGIKPPYDPAFPILGIYPEETTIEKDTCTPIFITAIFTIARTCKQDFLVAQTVKNLPVMQVTMVWSLGWEVPLEKGMATHSSILAWRIPWTEKPGRPQSMGSQRVGHDWEINTHRTCK